MKIQIKDKKREDYVNPALHAGRVYQELDTKDFYLAGVLLQNNELRVLLFSLRDGGVWKTSGGFGSGRFIDVTGNSTFVVEI